MRGQKNLLSRRDGKISLTKAHFQTGFQMKRRQLLQFDGSAALAPSLVHAQDKYPSKAITWICPYAAGGNIRTEAIACGKPDGYTVGMGNFAPLAVNHALFKNNWAKCMVLPQ